MEICPYLLLSISYYNFLNQNIKDRTDLTNFILFWASEIDNTRCILELFILSKLYQPAIYVYDQNDAIIFIFKNGIKFSKLHNINNKTDYDKVTSINIRLYFDDKKNIPYMIDALYMK